MNIFLNDRKENTIFHYFCIPSVKDISIFYKIVFKEHTLIFLRPSLVELKEAGLNIIFQK